MLDHPAAYQHMLVKISGCHFPVRDLARGAAMGCGHACDRGGSSRPRLVRTHRGPATAKIDPRRVPSGRSQLSVKQGVAPAPAGVPTDALRQLPVPPLMAATQVAAPQGSWMTDL